MHESNGQNINHRRDDDDDDNNKTFDSEADCDKCTSLSSRAGVRLKKDDPAASILTDSKLVTLFIIMPQNDFHEGEGKKGDPDYVKKGSLAVPGSKADSVRIANMIIRNIDKIDKIIVALDTHRKEHIAHASFWKPGNANKSNDSEPNKSAVIKPEEFQPISYDEVESEVWVPNSDNLKTWAKYYTTELCRHDRLKLTIWPEHCIVDDGYDSDGHEIVKTIQDALDDWEKYVTVKDSDKNVIKCVPRKVVRIEKGQNKLTELFSVLKAEVVDEFDPSTAFDWDLFNALRHSDKIYVCGQALR